jgi:hypothetical protein
VPDSTEQLSVRSLLCLPSPPTHSPRRLASSHSAALAPPLPRRTSRPRLPQEGGGRADERGALAAPRQAMGGAKGADKPPVAADDCCYHFGNGNKVRFLSIPSCAPPHP